MVLKRCLERLAEKTHELDTKNCSMVLREIADDTDKMLAERNKKNRLY